MSGTRQNLPHAALSRSRRPLILGFGSLLLLMVIMTLLGLKQMEASHQRLTQIVNQEMAKVKLVADMRFAARERTSSLLRMMLQEDAFELDEHWMYFNRVAGDFLVARDALLTKNLSAEEHALLEEQRDFTFQAVPAQKQVSDLIFKRESDKAKALLMQTAIPMQDKVLDALSRLQVLQEERARAALADVDRQEKHATLLLLGLSIGVIGLGFMITVVSLRHDTKADAALNHERGRALVTLQSIADAVVRTDLEGEVEYINPAALRLLGRPEAELLGRPLGEVVHLINETDGRELPDLAQTVLESGQPWTAIDNSLLLLVHGQQYPVQVTAVPIQDNAKNILGSVVVLHDVSALRALGRELTYQATHDALTGLLNRSEFDRRLALSIETARVENKQHSLCYLDLDLFKMINDSCGHLAGDEALRQIGARLQGAVRQGDTVARIGGDEFLVLLEGCPLPHGRQIAETLLRIVHETPFTWNDRSFPLAASIGLVEIDKHSANLQYILRQADDACRAAKEAGRNQIKLPPEDPGSHTQRTNWIERIGQALAEDEFELFGQLLHPIARHRPEIKHAEVLLRLRDKDGLLAPAAFLPAAERYHLMPAIDRWVIRNTLALLETHPDWTVNINLSGQSLCDSGFLPFVLHEFSRSRASTSGVCFEITETAAISNMTIASRFIAELSDIGCSFALDDFGSGLSSFGYLKNMRVQYVKIDGMFVRDIAEDPVDRAMVQCINEMAHVMGIQTVAEYVENEAIQAQLEGIGVDYAQGYLFGKPQPLRQLMSQPSAIG